MNSTKRPGTTIGSSQLGALESRGISVSAQDILGELGHEPATLAEFEAVHGSVKPSDGEQQSLRYGRFRSLVRSQFDCETSAMETGERGAEIERTYPELLTKLRSQVGFLERSAAHFDAGHEDEGEQLAARARVLLHDTRGSHSVLGQLGVKGALRFTDTAIHTQPETKHLGGNRYVATVTQHAGLVSWRSAEGGTWTFAPVLAPESRDRINPPVASEGWWRTPFLKDREGESISRSSVVLHVADKDGGAHVDKALPKAFYQLLSGSSLPFQTASDDGATSDIPGIVMATMRQIAYELLDTLHRDLPNFILGGPLRVGAELTIAERAGISRNAPCPCESGKRFKVCHGA